MVGIIEARFRKRKNLLEQIGHRSFVIIPHEMAVKKFLLSGEIVIFTNQLSVILSVYFHIFI